MQYENRRDAAMLKDAEDFGIDDIDRFPALVGKDLIEDLNEEGFDDPKNLTAADLPMIVRRIQLIENLAPQSADEVNAAAFAEAYKDLINMYAKLTK